MQYQIDIWMMDYQNGKWMMDWVGLPQSSSAAIANFPPPLPPKWQVHNWIWLWWLVLEERVFLISICISLSNKISKVLQFPSSLPRLPLMGNNWEGGECTCRTLHQVQKYFVISGWKGQSCPFFNQISTFILKWQVDDWFAQDDWEDLSLIWEAKVHTWKGGRRTCLGAKGQRRGDFHSRPIALDCTGLGSFPGAFYYQQVQNCPGHHNHFRALGEDGTSLVLRNNWVGVHWRRPPPLGWKDPVQED